MLKTEKIISYPILGEKSSQVKFKNTKTKNIRISIKSSLQIVVTFPAYCSLKKAKEFFESKIIWVQNSLQRMAKKQEIAGKCQKNNWPDLSKEELLAKKHYLILRCHQLAKEHNFAFKKVIVRKQKTIWGSCSSKNNISLNINLAFLKKELVDYVILHELVHTKVKNHSRVFWRELEKVLPECRGLDKELKGFMAV